MVGPLWLGKLHDKEFVNQVIEHVNEKGSE